MNASRGKPVQDFSGKPDPEQVRRELAAILGSPSFRGSKRCTDLLCYLVEKTLDGNGKSIEEGRLSIDVFGREENGGPADSGIVRVGAREVRKRLAQYYEAEGSQDDVRIDLPEQSYIPKFRALKVPDAEPATIPEPPPKPVVVESAPKIPPVVRAVPPPPKAPPKRPIPEPAPVAASAPAIVPPAPVAQPSIAAASAPIVGSPVLPHVTPDPVPMTAPDIAPIVAPTPKRFPWIWIAAAFGILVAAVLGWRAMRTGTTEFDQFWGPAFQQESPIQIVLGPPSRPGQAVDFGKASALSLLSQAFGQRSRQVEVTEEAGSSAPKDSTVVYLGGVDNAAALGWSKEFRFHFAEQGGQAAIVDASNGKRWTSQDGNYFLICRIQSGFGVLAGGLTQTASAEAGRVLTKAGVLAPLLRKLPQDWASRNLELLLMSPGANRTPELTAFQQW